jgi:hexosaminidase
MKNILMLLLVAFVSNAQIKKEQLDLMPWPQNINLNKGVFTLTKSFKVNITRGFLWAQPVFYAG